MRLPKWAVTVTPLSKTIAMLLFVSLPFIGFYIGVKQTPSLPIKTNSTTIIKKVKIYPTDSPKKLVERCGEYPSDLDIDDNKFNVVSGPLWSPDCRHITWSIWISGTSCPDCPSVTNISLQEGIYLYDYNSKKISKIYTPKRINETPTINYWQNRNELNVTIKDKNYIIDITDNTIKSK